ncbi:DNA primase, catalytic core [Friedmanniella luteola]|uniref:DNA primase, catalytic core n=1 Tax=Friedmanniella luteola TaxID=546871 RepID=A0A1H1WQU9_9ACTN|nr:MobF family relaxase [Friedmanniella luteola]SDS99627.1 DNA primase, catalytic core [Friedmanniella luteola]
MSIHKLTAGSGYDYLTRQVAALDATDKGHTGLAQYYSQRGEQPGVWVGAGMAGIDGLAVGDPVTAEQMQALFGHGLHPLADQNRERLAGPDLTEADYRAVTRLGAPFRIYSPDVSPFRREVAARIAAVNKTAGLPGDWPVPLPERARVRTEVATEFFRREHGRNPAGPRELAGTIAELSRPQTTAVAGFDLTFSPVKSVSTLWAVADRPVAALVEEAHRAAVADALRFLESHALFTREGTNGVRQVNVRGLVAAAFTHRDSRAGDPDLHTHVAVANKVQTLDGRWLAVDGRILFKATVVASETYNTALEHHLTTLVGVRFAERPNSDPRKRPVREIVGVDPTLNNRWSARRQAIESRQAELAAAFQHAQGRPPTSVEAVQLAQRATLETRDNKHEPRSLADQRATWRAQALQVLGGPRQLHGMLTNTLNPPSRPSVQTDAEWVERTARAVVATVEGQRATWQVWHLRAEAHRRLRSTDTAGPEIERLVDRIVQHSLTGSVRVDRPGDGVVEPRELRRVDGASVYTVAGSALYTSYRILAAEQRLVAIAGHTDHRRLDPALVEQAIAASTADGVALDDGQAGLVRAMASSGCRLQLAIAPAGAGKTTALAALTRAWTADGGQVVGLAPSAAAAGQLRGHTGAPTDTLAKLTWAIDHHTDLPDWATRIGPRTLVLVDEAGMADTLSLDTAVAFVTGRGGSVRLVGDDQQLAAIGAGGVLRDIATTHGAIRLHQLHRFTDPAEAAASLALRDGRPEALGFYLDQHRVHVGDQTTMTDQVFTAWQTDRSKGLDAVMLAPTRDLVADLNSRARTHRLATTQDTPPTREVVLADGNQASAGDLVLTRSNDRRLRVTATDWVKNGDRWTVLNLPPTGGLTVQHTQTHRTVTLPRDYVQTAVELGYATTVHAAQGVTADTTHGLADGRESRQQLYTMLTRGRTANHLYLPVVGDGDPHTVIRPGTTHPLTPTDMLEQILARDAAPLSATTLRRVDSEPMSRLGDACDRYRDALHVAAEHLAGPDTLTALHHIAETLSPGLTDEPAWPTLQAHLLLHAADGDNLTELLTAVAGQRELGSALDRAAVLDDRLDDRPLRTPGPLPWLPGIPDQLAAHPQWGNYLTRRAALVTQLADQVRISTEPDRTTPGITTPSWAEQQPGRLAPELVLAVQVWRAATHVDPDDRRPTGPRGQDRVGRAWQDELNRRLAGDTPAVKEWAPLLTQLHPSLAGDPFTGVLAGRLAALNRTGTPAVQLLRQAAAGSALPDDHAAAALWWRITRHLTPATKAPAYPQSSEGWAERLAGHVGATRAAGLQCSPWWPALSNTIDRGLHRGWTLHDLLPPQRLGTGLPGEPEALTLLRRATTLTTPPPPPTEENPPTPQDLPPADLWDGFDAASGHRLPGSASTTDTRRPDAPAEPAAATSNADYLDADLAVAAMVRDTLGPLPPSAADHERAYQRALAWDHSPVTRERLVAVNDLACQFYQSQLPGSWGQAYLTERLRTDLTGHPDYRPGHAPAAWTALTTHLRRHGVTDDELTAAGLVTIASTGQLIDRFRDRALLPITADGEVLGFVGRRHPDRDNAGPKYLNTPTTPLFHKGDQLYGALDQPLHDGAVPVLVEGPLDAIAVTLATNSRCIGVAPLGTALTHEQAAQLATYGADPVVATDNDAAGRTAAGRAYWLLTAHNLDPGHAQLPANSDPAQLLAERGPTALGSALLRAQPLGDTMINVRLAHLTGSEAAAELAQIIAARPAQEWEPAVRSAAARSGLPVDHLSRQLLSAARARNVDPLAASEAALQTLRHSSARPAASNGQDQRQVGAKLSAPTGASARPSAARFRAANSTRNRASSGSGTRTTRMPAPRPGTQPPPPPTMGRV